MSHKYISSINRNIVFVKLFLGIVGISTLAVIILSMSFFFLFRSKTVEEINTVDTMSLNNINTLMYNYIDSTEKTVLTTYQDNTIKKLMLENSREWNDNMMKAANYTTNSISTYEFISSIDIFGKSGILLKTSSSEIPEEYENKLIGFLKTEPSGKLIPWKFKASTGKTSNIMSIFISENNIGHKGPDSAVMANINMDLVHDRIFPNALREDEEIFVIDRDGIVLLHSNMEQFFIDKSNMPFMQKIFSDNNEFGNFTTEMNDNKYNISYVYSKQGNYYVVHIMDYDLNIQKLNGTMKTILIFSILILFLVLVFSLYISYRIYSPINNIFVNIRGLFSDPIPVSTSLNQIQIMSNVTTKIIEKMNSYEKDIENRVVLELFTLSGSIIKTDEIINILKKMNIYSHIISNYSIIVLRIGNYKEFEESNTMQSIDFQINSICNITSEYLSAHSLCYSYKLNNEHAVLIVAEGDKSISLSRINIKNSLDEASNTIFNMLSLEVTIGISDIFCDISDIPKAYQEAYKLTNYRLSFGKKSVINSSIIDFNEKDDSDTLSPHIDDVVNAVKQSSMSNYETALIKLFSLCKCKNYDSIINIFTELSISILKIPSDAGLNNNIVHHDFHKIYKQFEKLEDFSQVMDTFIEIFKETTLALANLGSTNVRDIVSKAIEFISSNYYNQDITANYMADKLSISPQYFSKIFKECTNSSFPDYIINIRLEKARELLIKDQNQEITEICVRVGYNSASYFTAAFKKKYGITPSKYRANYLYNNNLDS